MQNLKFIFYALMKLFLSLKKKITYSLNLKRIAKPYEYKKGDWRYLKTGSSGTTYFSSLFNSYMENHTELLIVITDGYIYDIDRLKKYNNTLWLISEHRDEPFQAPRLEKHKNYICNSREKIKNFREELMIKDSFLLSIYHAGIHDKNFNFDENIETILNSSDPEIIFLCGKDWNIFNHEKGLDKLIMAGIPNLATKPAFSGSLSISIRG